jgi:phosphatidylserine/phosphatidylglycerophosphate/cardiolipin synthase-like enzyme
MAARACRKRVESRLNCETLEERRLLFANMPASPAAEVRALVQAGPLEKAPSLFIEPQAGRAPIIQAINAARIEIRLGICNLSDPQIGDALAAAVARGVNVEVIADQADYSQKPDEQAKLTTLIGECVSVHLSNSVFPQSFAKELVIDQRQVLSDPGP